MKYDICQIGRSWCLNDRLDLSNHTGHPMLPKKWLKKNKKNDKHENPLYFWVGGTLK